MGITSSKTIELICIKSDKVKILNRCDVVYAPYIEPLKFGNKIVGHHAVQAYLDKDGNKYRPYYGKISLESVSLTVLDLESRIKRNNCE